MLVLSIFFHVIVYWIPHNKPRNKTKQKFKIIKQIKSTAEYKLRYKNEKTFSVLFNFTFKKEIVDPSYKTRLSTEP